MAGHYHGQCVYVCVCQGVVSIWSVLMCKPVDPPVQQTECLTLMSDFRGQFPPQLSLLCQLNTNSKNHFYIQTGPLTVCLFVCLFRVGPGHPFSPCSFTSSSFPPLLFPFFHWLYLFSSFIHPFPFYQNSPTPFPGQRSWRRPNLGLCFVV